jgi:predicted metal-dependent hydrolase
MRGRPAHNREMLEHYDLRVSARARAMRVSVYPGGAVTVTVPRRYSIRALERFLSRYAPWIERAQKRSTSLRTIRAKRGAIPAYKERARALLTERCAYFAERYGVHYAKITIRAQKRRWGSCSRAGNLSFNYKIALLSPELVDYIVVHELCHLLQFDHSRAFWALVEREVPQHRMFRKMLRETTFRFD